MTDAPTDDLPDVIHGPRLDLVLVTVEQLLSRDGAADPVPLGYEDPYDVLDPAQSPLRFRIPQVRADASVNPWLLRLAVRRTDGVVVGYANFHDRPDENGMVEVGYTVADAERGRGYGREIAHTMWRAAAALPSVRVLRATVSPGNAPSIAIIEGAGLVNVGEQWDEEDGLELVYEIAPDRATLDPAGPELGGGGR